MPNTQRPESARDAIELMTAWLGCPDGQPDLLVDCLRNHINGRPGGLTGAAHLIMGLTYLCGSLLILREYETGVTARETVQKLALEYAQD